METRLCKLSIQRQMVVTHTFYFMLCQSSPGGGTPILGHIRYVRPEWVRFPGQNLRMGVNF